MRVPFITDPFAEADDDTGDTKKVENHIHIRIQRRFFLPVQLQVFSIASLVARS